MRHSGSNVYRPRVIASIVECTALGHKYTSDPAHSAAGRAAGFVVRGRPNPAAPNVVLLRNVLVDQRSDGTERHIEITGQAVHSSHGGKRNQRQNQKVLHESLALFVSVQA